MVIPARPTVAPAPAAAHTTSPHPRPHRLTTVHDAAPRTHPPCMRLHHAARTSALTTAPHHSHCPV
ncbi:hypothetical protein E2C01_027178 [Portunus trituberculatus]|uniref:Uncharacterized protein n=1 Tax=Portunus trituberculatus TaxID=210409 RepID=A0A5B7EN24_PORTR|nr:hypothetical protein [Portunus trituberculatus]